MFFWQRREVYCGNLEGLNRARRILADNGVACESRTVRREGGFSIAAQSRMASLGQTFDADSLYYLYVRRADAAQSRRLLGVGERIR